jgi:hypothetical protein
MTAAIGVDMIGLPTGWPQMLAAGFVLLTSAFPLAMWWTSRHQIAQGL